MSQGIYTTEYLRKRRNVRIAFWTPITILGLALCVFFGAQAMAEPAYSLPACETEDSTNCYWDADARGNGEGQSFISVNEVVTYVE